MCDHMLAIIYQQSYTCKSYMCANICDHMLVIIYEQDNVLLLYLLLTDVTIL